MLPINMPGSQHPLACALHACMILCRAALHAATRMIFQIAVAVLCLLAVYSIAVHSQK